MQHSIRKIFLGLAGLLLSSLPAQAGTNNPPPVTRKDLLDATVHPPQQLSKVSIKEVTLGPHLRAPMHLHPGAVIGVVLEGEIVFQIEGEQVRRLKTGDGFYEPANTRIAHFDNAGPKPARFAAFYLLEYDDQELIRLLPQ